MDNAFVPLKEALDAAHGHPHKEDGAEMSQEETAATGAGGGDHDHHEARPLWKYVSGALLLLLLASLFSPRFQPTSES